MDTAAQHEGSAQYEGSTQHEDSAPHYTDDEMRELIRKTFDEDAIIDTSIDLFIYQWAESKSNGNRYDRWYSWEYHFGDLKGPVADSGTSALIPFINQKLQEHNLPPRDDLDETFILSRVYARGKLWWPRLTSDTWPERRGIRQTQEGERHVASDALLQQAQDILRPKMLPGPPAHEVWPTHADKGAHGLASIAESQLLRQLMDAVKGDRSLATFTCGGVVNIEESSANSCTLGVCLPVTIDWVGGDALTRGRTTFPGNTRKDSEAYTCPDGFEELQSACQVASFGLDDKDVVDLEYRNALSLQAAHFNTSFGPYRTGIIRAISQTLLPNRVDSRNPHFVDIVAEPHKLNIYSAPSGRFRSHVDTPRGHSHFGSLVVCLPSQHQGGALLVRHQGKEVNYDWSRLDANSIGWAAFYSDCEHQILDVTEGHRITLTYNLHVRDSSVPAALAIDFDDMIMPRLMRSFLEQPGFLRDGAVLGLFCSHRYLHENQEPADKAYFLKGTDLAVYMAFESLGLLVDVYPILKYKNEYGGMHINQPRALTKDHAYEDGYQSSPGSETREERLRLQYDEDGQSDSESEYKHGYWEDVRHKCQRDKREVKMTPNFGHHLRELRKRRVKGINQRSRPYQGQDVIVGLESGLHLDADEQYEVEQDEIIDRAWPHVTLETVTWLNHAKHDDVALTNIAYGNQASLDWHYSSTAILVSVPPYSRRSQPKSDAVMFDAAPMPE